MTTTIPMSENEFANFLCGEVAYVKDVVHEGRAGLSIHAANGAQIVIFLGTKDDAFCRIRSNNMKPLLVH